MPAVQSRIVVDSKPPNDEETLPKKSKNRDRTASRKTDTNKDPSNQIRRKKNHIPELDMKPLSPKNQRKNPRKDDNCRRSQNATSARGNLDAKAAKKRQVDIGNAYSKSNKSGKRVNVLENHGSLEDDMQTARSLFCLSPTQDPTKSLVDLENINPNKLADNFYECNEFDYFLRSQFPDFESCSEYGYETPGILDDFDVPSMSSSRTNKPPQPLKHFKELLCQQENSNTNLLADTEISLLRNIVKADERHQKLRKDDYNLLKDILHGQLKEIEHQERVIKIALKKIFGRDNDGIEVTTLKVDNAEQPMETTGENPESMKPRPEITESELLQKTNPIRIQRQEVDIIFKNVPTLEKEIQILRLLGSQLEETLKRSSHKMTCDRQNCNLMVHRPKSVYFAHNLSVPAFGVNTLGVKCITEVAQEFKIQHQTINELKLEKEFFIPEDQDRFTLRRTNFDNLARNPELLFKRLKPFTKGATMKFNIIEQDPMFFNHFLTKFSRICTPRGYDHDQENLLPNNFDVLKKNVSSQMIFMHRGDGDQTNIALQDDKSIVSGRDIGKIKIPSNDSLSKKKKRKQTATPLTEGYKMDVKNSLLKIVLLGALHLSVLLTVAAIMYPEITCL